MVITPQQVHEKALVEARASFKALEKKIDRALMDDYVVGDSCGVCIDLDVSSSDPVYQLIQRKYEEAGWTVKYECDQRDGDFVRFTQRRVGWNSR
ncbi:Uncharacterised protein [uncultured archaeon]|nr:Uncharacterised protein [uncultured archaeon]